MSVNFVNKEFSRVGRKTEGEPDSKYSARQIAPVMDGDKETGIGISVESAQAFLSDALECTNGDLAKVAECFVTGYNHHARLEAGGYDEWQKAAKKLLASGLPFVKGWTLEKAVTFLKSQS